MSYLLLYTETVIDSSHKLIGYKGNCSNLHGHSWLIEVFIKGKPSQMNKIGILFDFSNIKKIKDKYDHKFLNEIPPFNKINPTAENICQEIYKQLKEINDSLLFVVKVYETNIGKKTWCQFGDWEV